VAGIAAAGNPNARLLNARITFDYRMLPDAPTVAEAHRSAAAAYEIVDYFKQNGVRVVNMSWGGSVSGVESALERNGVGDSPEERKALARKIFDIQLNALRDAMASAPEILFIAAAGNSDNDNEFDEFIPSSIDLPNLMTVAAVDQAGEEASFTTLGKVDVHANGFEVDSYVPGGDRLKFSGTSMAAPNVANLAGKLLALDPSLDVATLRELIEGAADERVVGERTFRLINPKQSVEKLEKRKAS
jgi:subtilisin family serine protease